MYRVVIRLLFCLLLLESVSGCLEIRKGHSIVRVWADYNSLAEPALFLEKLHHQPYRATMVDSYRWMYDVSPGKLADQQHTVESFVQPDQVQESSPAPQVEPGSDSGVPPAEAMDFDQN